MQTTITVFVDTPVSIAGWGYTHDHETSGAQRLARIASQFPTPHFEVAVTRGRRVHIQLSDTLDQAHAVVDRLIRNRPHIQPLTQLKDMVAHMGNIPLTPIHDPQLAKKVSSLWTLDVSYNPGLSIKDIMARQMVDDALASNRIVPGKTTIIEGTSGNTGAGLALVNLYYGFHTILVIPDKMSEEKIERLRSLGADVIVTPTQVEPHHPLSYYSIRDYVGTHPHTWVPQQYDNLSNTKAHYLTTGPSIWNGTHKKVTKVIIATGTGGTVTGVARYLKENNADIQVIGVDTIGSILYLLKRGYKIQDVAHLAHSYTIQGFGEDIQPKNLDLSLIDSYIRVSDASGLLMTQVLPALGYFQGHSSGAVYAALLEAIETKQINPHDNVVIIFPDTVMPYRFDVMNDEWMRKNRFTLHNPQHDAMQADLARGGRALGGHGKTMRAGAAAGHV